MSNNVSSIRKTYTHTNGRDKFNVSLFINMIGIWHSVSQSQCYNSIMNKRQPFTALKMYNNDATIVTRFVSTNVPGVPGSLSFESPTMNITRSSLFHRMSRYILVRSVPFLRICTLSDLDESPMSLVPCATGTFVRKMLIAEWYSKVRSHIPNNPLLGAKVY